MAAPIRFLSGRQQQQKIGIQGSTESEKVLEVIGRVGIGTTVFEPSIELDVRGSVSIADTITASTISATTIVTTGTGSTFPDLQVGGISTFTGLIDANGGLDVTGHTELDNVNASGISSATAFANFDYLQAPFGSTVTFTVTVASKDSSHRYNGTGSGNAYLINGVQAPFLTLTPGRTYRFTNDNTGSHPLKFYLEADKTTEYTSGVNFQNTYTEITIGDETPVVLHYQCTAHGYMGNAIQTNSNVVNTNYDAVLRGGLNVSGSSTFTGLIDANGGITATTGTFEDLIGAGAIVFSTGSGKLDDHGNLSYTSASSTLNVVNLDISNDVDIDGHTELDDVNVSGLSTFTGLIDANGGLDVTGHSELDNVNVSGVITTTTLTVNSGSGNTAYISGPSEIWIDPAPAGVGTNPGLVRIRGDLYVDGTEFIVDVDKVQLGDFRIGIATTAGTNLLLDGAGLGIGSESIEKTITWNNATSALMSSENWNLASGKHYEIGGTDVLTSTTLGSGVVNSSLTNVGTLTTLTVSGNINANGNIVGDNATNISGINSVTATNLFGTLQTAAQTNITSLGSLTGLNVVGITTVSGNINANGNIVGDSATNISGINSVTAGSFHGSGIGLTGITPGQIGALANIVEDTTPQLGGNLDLNGKLINGTGGVNITGIVTATSFVGDGSGLNIPGISTIGNSTFNELTVTGIATFSNDVNFIGNSANIVFDKSADALEFKDTAKAIFGTGDDLTIFHNSHSYIDHSGTNNLHIRNTTNDQDITIQTDDGSGNLATYFQAEGASGEASLHYYGAKKLATKSGGIQVTGTVTATTFFGNGANLTGIQTGIPGISTTGISSFTNLNVSGIATFAQGGGNGEIKIYENSNDPTIEKSGSGSLIIKANNNIDVTANNNYQARFGDGGGYGASNDGVSLFFSGNEKFATTGTGATVTGALDVSGNVTATQFHGNGSNITGVSAPNIITTDESSDTTCFPVFVNAVGTSQGPRTDESALTYNASTGTFTATDFNSASDENLKENIRTIEDPLAKIAQIRGVNFDWKENKKPSVGVIAQEVEKVFPELVTSREKKSVNYNGLIGLLIEVVKEQQTQINSLNDRLSQLE